MIELQQYCRDAGAINAAVDPYFVEGDSSKVNLEKRCICRFDRFRYPWAFGDHLTFSYVLARPITKKFRKGPVLSKSCTNGCQCTARSSDPVILLDTITQRGEKLHEGL